MLVVWHSRDGEGGGFFSYILALIWVCFILILLMPCIIVGLLLYYIYVLFFETEAEREYYLYEHERNRQG